MTVMKPVVQEDVTGCGIASVATLAELTYQKTKTLAHQLGIDIKDPRLWSDTTHVRKLLTHFNIQASYKEIPFRAWKALPPLALLAIKWSRKGTKSCWHWVVYWQGPQGPVVLDPKRTLRTHVRTDFGRIKPKWFISLIVPTDTP